MRNILLSFALALFAMVSFNQAAVAASTPVTKPHLAQAKQTLAWPTDVLVENYSGQPVTVRFITIVTDDTTVVDAYPAARYYAQLLHQFTAYQVRVLIWDVYGRLFYDQNVGSVSRVTLNPPAKNAKLSAQNVQILK